MKRVVFVVDHFYSDQAGTENQLSKLIRGLASRFDLELITFRDSEWARTTAKLPCRITVFQIDKFTRLYTYRNLFRFLRHLRARRPHVVHTFFPVANILGVLCARLAGVPAIVASRRDYGEWMSARYLYATRIANRFATGIVANSHEVKRLTERVEGFSGDRIEVIYNGIALERFGRKTDPCSIKSTLGIPETHKVVGLVANYRPMKRHDTFVRAAAQILRRRDDISFLLLGKNAFRGNPKKRVEDLVTALGVGHRVHFSHAAGNVQDYLALIDVGVNCSEGEGLSNAIMEYMAAGVPCVVSDSGGNPDLITDGVHGYTFPVGDSDALAQKILRMLDDEPARRRFTERAYARVRDEMSVEAMLDHFTRYYTGLTEKAAPSGAHIPGKTAKSETRG